jgi:hypothetical protein
MDIITEFIIGTIYGSSARASNVERTLGSLGGLIMEHDPLDAVYSFVERAYIRLQAGDVLFRCMEERDISPLQSWVEGLVYAGPKNLDALREILAEVSERQSQSDEDIRQVLEDFRSSLKSFGVRVVGYESGQSLVRLTPIRLLSVLREQGITEEETQVACLQLLRDTRDLVTSLASYARLLDEIETYLQDWLWGLMYQTAHQEMVQRARPFII